MKLTQLEYFCVAARYHNITRASKELFVTQPSVSNAIKALEEEFGVNLFYRNNNKLTLTPEGEKFYQNAEELLAHADAVRSELHELRKQITPVRIGIPPMLGTIYLPDMYLSLKEEFPDVDFRLYEYGSIKACELVLEGKLDLAIVNAEQSAIRAGYSKKYARGNAYKLIARQDVQQYIAYLRYLQSVNPTSPILHIATINEIQGFWTNVMDSNRYDIKDRLRASELLAKSIGGFDEF